MQGFPGGPSSIPLTYECCTGFQAYVLSALALFAAPGNLEAFLRLDEF